MLLKDEIEDPPIYYNLHRMADLGLGLLHRALDAIVTLDVAVARAIPIEDDQVDRLYNHVYLQLIQAMMTDKNDDQPRQPFDVGCP